MMNQYNNALETLREKGCRLTPQRVMVLSALTKRPGHLGVSEISQAVYKQYPYIDVATVYRTLQLLKRLHLVTELDVGGAARYELIDVEHHHHMVCNECDNAFDFSPSYLNEFRNTLMREFGFEPDLEHFAIGGKCAGCAGRGAGPPG